MTTINCNLTERDYRSFRRYVIFRYRKMHWIFGVLLVALLALDWFGNKPEATMKERIAGLVGLIVLWAIATLVLLVVWKVITHFTGGRFRGSLGPHVFEIGEETFAESNAQGRHELKIQGLRRVVETNSHFFVITNTGTSYVIPKRDLQSHDSLHALQRIVAGGGA